MPVPIRHTAISLLIIALIGAMPVVLTSVAIQATAQERVEKKSFFQRLFGRKSTKNKARKRTSRVRRSVRNSASASPPKPKIEKFENAHKILVLGDFVGKGAASGLREAFAEAPGVVIVDRTNGSSGLVRTDYYNWPAQAPGIIEEVQPAIIVAQLGSNDRQQLKIDGVREAVRSPAWLAEYERRTRELIALLRAGNTPFLWIGQPAFKSSSMTTDIVALNGIYRKQVAIYGGEYIDIWDGFVDEAGKFVFTGSDINGRQVRLRSSDGINLTRAGKRKIAFYAEKSIRRLLGDAAATGAEAVGFAAFDSQSLPDIFMPPSPGETSAATARTRPVAMTDPDLDGGSALLGEMPTTASLIRSPRDQLVIEGIMPKPPEGRVNNFAWPRP